MVLVIKKITNKGFGEFNRLSFLLIWVFSFIAHIEHWVILPSFFFFKFNIRFKDRLIRGDQYHRLFAGVTF